MATERIMGEFTCVECGAKFSRFYNPRSHKPGICDECQHKKKVERDRRRRAEMRDEHPRCIVKKCRRCGRVFEDKRLKPYKMPTSDEGYVEHRYCPSCRWAQKRAARACDSRYVGVGGHGDVLEYRTVRGEA